MEDNTTGKGFIKIRKIMSKEKGKIKVISGQANPSLRQVEGNLKGKIYSVLVKDLTSNNKEL